MVGITPAPLFHRSAAIPVLTGPEARRGPKKRFASGRCPQEKWISSENCTAFLTIIQRWGILFNAVTGAAPGWPEIIRMGGRLAPGCVRNESCSGIEVVITALTRNQVYQQWYRGFESHPLRHAAASVISLAATFFKITAHSFCRSRCPRRQSILTLQRENL